jgi:hypothetical protein
MVGGPSKSNAFESRTRFHTPSTKAELDDSRKQNFNALVSGESTPTVDLARSVRAASSTKTISVDWTVPFRFTSLYQHGFRSLPRLHLLDDNEQAEDARACCPL